MGKMWSGPTAKVQATKAEIVKLLASDEPRVVTVIKEVPVEVEKLVYVDRIVEVEKIVKVDVVREVEVVKHVEVPVVTEIEKIVQMPIHVIKRVEIEVLKVPKFIWIIMAIQTLVIVGLLIK